MIKFSLVLLLVLCGCAKQQKVSDLDVLWTDGECLFHSKGMTIEQAEQIKKAWKFGGCEVTVHTDDEGKSRKPPKQ